MASNFIVKRIEGRKNEPQEFVEFRIKQANRSFIAQESGGWWIVYDNHLGENGRCTSLESFPPGHEQEAIDYACSATENFVMAQG